MTWLNGPPVEVALRLRGYPGIRGKLEYTTGQARATFKSGQLRYKIMREHFEGLRDDLRPIEFIDVHMIKHYLRAPWGMPS